MMPKTRQALLKKIRDDFRVALAVLVLAVAGAVGEIIPDTIQILFLIGVALTTSCLQGRFCGPQNSKRNQRGGIFIFILCLFFFGFIGYTLFSVLGMVVALIVVTVVYVTSASSEQRETERENEHKRLVAGQLVRCDGCGKPISALADKCPNCGHPQDPEKLARAREREAEKIAKAEEEKKAREAAVKAEEEYKEANPHLFCPACKAKIKPGGRQCRSCWLWSCPKCREEIWPFARRCRHCDWTKSGTGIK